MPSITEYSATTKKGLMLLKTLHPSYKQRKELLTCFKIIDKSLTLEAQSTALGVKAVDDEITALYGDIGALVEFTAQGYQHTKVYPVPRVSDKFSLMFAILFYQSLSNYDQVEYQGNAWGASLVIAKIKERQAFAVSQAQAVKEEIQRFLKEKDIALDKDLIEKPNLENSDVFIHKLYAALSNFSVLDEAEIEAPAVPTAQQFLSTNMYWLYHANESLKHYLQLLRHYYQCQKNVNDMQKALSKLSYFQQWFNPPYRLKDALAALNYAKGAVKAHLQEGETIASHLRKMIEEVDIAKVSYRMSTFEMGLYPLAPEPTQKPADESISLNFFKPANISAELQENVQQSFWSRFSV